MPKLSEKQRKFVEAYQGITNGNATQAARLAGYSGNDNALAVAGSELLRNPKILEVLAENQKNDPLVLDRKARQEILSRIAMGIEPEYVNTALGAVETPTAMANRLKAFDQLNKMGGDYSETVKHDFGDQLKTAHNLLDATGTTVA